MAHNGGRIIRVNFFGMENSAQILLINVNVYVISDFVNSFIQIANAVPRKKGVKKRS